MSESLISAEETSLKVHVQICAARNREIARRLGQIEVDTKKLDQIDAVAKRLGRVELAMWSILAALGTGGAVTVQQLLPIARALAGQ